VEFPPDEDLKAVLRDLRVEPSALLGRGGEAWVYALDESKVVRVCHAGTNLDSVLQRQTLVAELSAAAPAPFALPETIRIEERHGRIVCVERRLTGVSLLEALAEETGAEREQLIVAYLDTAASLGDLTLTPRGWFGELIGTNAVRSPTWIDYLRDRAAASLNIGGFSALADPNELACAMPTCSQASFVHLDAFPGNMLVHDAKVSAVIDFSVTCLSGDRRLDPLAASIYLATPTITPTARPGDLALANEWLRGQSLGDFVQPTKRWLAAFWSFGVTDPKLRSWCQSVLTA
jgi:aminoglycoside phosphotransferase (APT) family kinase protein